MGNALAMTGSAVFPPVCHCEAPLRQTCMAPLHEARGNLNPGWRNMALDLKTWWLAVRPFSFPASAIPVIFGTAAAVAVGGAAFSFSKCVPALLAMMMLQGAANLLNDVHDFNLGLDTRVFPGSGAVVRRIISPETARKASILLFTAGGAAGICLAAVSSSHTPARPSV